MSGQLEWLTIIMILGFVGTNYVLIEIFKVLRRIEKREAGK